MPDVAPCFTNEGLNKEFLQGEILSNVTQYMFDSSNSGANIKVIPFVLVLSQDCDLLRDYEARLENNQSPLNDILLYEAEPAETARKRLGLNSTLWQPISINNNERFHILPAVSEMLDTTGKGIPSLLIDFRRYFGIQPTELVRQVVADGQAVRRSCLATPFKEHLQSRAAFYFQRVSLPDGYLSR